MLGTVGWTQVGRAWDALRFGIYPTDGFGVDVFAGRYAVGFEDAAFEDASFLNRDGWLTGAYFKLRKFTEPALDEVDLYALYDVLSDDEPNTRNLLGLGARLSGEWGIVDGEAEGVYELGSRYVQDQDTNTCTDETVDLSAWMIDTELGVNVYEPAAVRIFAGYSRATGDDPDTEESEAYFQFYPTAHKWMGLMDIIGPRSNIQEIKGGFSFAAAPFKFRESVHYFTRLEPESEAVGLKFDAVTSVGLEKTSTWASATGCSCRWTACRMTASPTVSPTGSSCR